MITGISADAIICRKFGIVNSSAAAMKQTFTFNAQCLSLGSQSEHGMKPMKIKRQSFWTEPSAYHLMCLPYVQHDSSQIFIAQL